MNLLVKFLDGTTEEFANAYGYPLTCGLVEIKDRDTNQTLALLQNFAALFSVD